ncbi:MAG TPA: NADH-quinone oxidoreductase subunit NuoG [Hyphomicrobiaceae bacterium]|nr:NADH-quinone oxidoreductase subunit NuoG [Hyphomicrobiaceae bacterium]
MAKKLIIDGQEIEVEDGLTLLQACEQAGVEVPRFCYHERLSIAGNCRMCLVEVVGMPKLQASCALGVNDLPPNRDGSPKVINTTSPVVKKAREGVMEFLLINHPLDCPICDQGGECDLQDQAMAYGVGRSRYDENKRAVEEKNLGPLIKTMMTRCIQCTRCVRFMTEVAGVEELGAIGRGEDMEITTYLERGMYSEMSANVADICPVGALTHRPTAFNARPWEMVKTETIDVMDAVGSAITVQTRGRDVMRILPRNNDDVNEEWISDKTRHVADGLRTQRLDQPYVRDGGRLRPASWDEAIALVGAKLRETPASRIGAIAGDMATAEEMFALKDLFTRLGSANVDCRQDGSRLDGSAGRASYIFNPTIAGIEQADAVVLIGTNPRVEAPILNARILKRYRQTGVFVGVVGARCDLNYPCTHIGAGPESIGSIAAALPPGAKSVVFIVGSAVAARPDGLAVLSSAVKAAQAVGAIRDGWNGFGVLQTVASRVGGLDVGFVPGKGGKTAQDMASGGVDVLYLLGADEMDLAKARSSFVIYQGSHGDAGAHRADVILPGSAYTEKTGIFVNLEGRVQSTKKAAAAPGLAKDDWAIIRAVSAAAGKTLPYDSFDALRAALFKAVPHMARIGAISPGDTGQAVTGLTGSAGAVTAQPFGQAVSDFYMTNPVARASSVMAELSALMAARGKTRQAAE